DLPGRWRLCDPARSSAWRLSARPRPEDGSGSGCGLYARAAVRLAHDLRHRWPGICRGCRLRRQLLGRLPRLRPATRPVSNKPAGRFAACRSLAHLLKENDSMKVHVIAFAVVSVAATSGFSTLLFAQSAQQVSSWSGVYTAAQADNGRKLFDDNCAKCHQSTLEGMDEIPALK